VEHFSVSMIRCARLFTDAAGEQGVFGPGGFFLMEHTTGEGHAKRVFGNQDLKMAITALPDAT
jgi:hypothetical protein